MSGWVYFISRIKMANPCRAIFLIILIIILAPFDIHAGTLKVYFLDVGEGESIYIETPESKNVLIDSGNLITVNKVAEFFNRHNIKRLDLMIITHPHSDHMGGVFRILNDIQVDKRYDNGQPVGNTTCDNLYRWYEEFYRKGNYSVLKSGDIISLGRVVIKVLSPPDLSQNWNDNSLVLKLLYGRTSFLFMGDATLNVERWLLLRKKEELKADVLKVGHHGAGDSASEAFLKAVSPEYAVISINKDNIRGYPSEEVIQRLKRLGIKVSLTCKEGDILIESNGLEIKRLFNRPLPF